MMLFLIPIRPCSQKLDYNIQETIPRSVLNMIFQNGAKGIFWIHIKLEFLVFWILVNLRLINNQNFNKNQFFCGFLTNICEIDPHRGQ